MNDRADPRVMVVGGGIGGLAVALALAHKGVGSLVLEQADELVEIGAGIQLAPNALRALDRLGVLELVQASWVAPRRAVMRNAETAAQIGEIDFGDAFRARYGHPYVVTHRSDLHGALLSTCRRSALVQIATGARVVTVDQSDDLVTVVTARGDRHSGALLIGADGLHSMVRRYVIDSRLPICTGDVAYRGTVPRDSALTDEATDLTWWVGPGMHLIQYPVRNGRELNQVAVFTSARRTPGADPSDSWGGPDELDHFFRDKAPEVRRGAESIDRSRHWKLFDRDPDATWVRGRVALLGDAAHPMLQYLAQGGCQALEDALVLADCVDAQRADLAAALAEYERERVPRTARVQRSARAMGEIVHGSGVVSALRDELLRSLSPDDFRFVDWLYGYDYPDKNGETL